MQLQPYIYLDSLTFLFLALELAVCLVLHIVYKTLNLFFLKKKNRQTIKLLIAFLTGYTIAGVFLGLEYLQQFIFNNNKIFFLPLVTVMFIYFLAINKHFLIALISYAMLIIQLFAFSNWTINMNYIFCLILMAVSFTNIIVNMVIKKYKEQYLLINYVINYITSSLVLVVVTLISSQQFENIVNILVLSFAAMFFLLVTHSLELFFIKLSKKVTSKSKQLIYTEEYFVLPKLIPNYFLELVKAKQYKHYLIVTFFIENLDIVKKKMNTKQYDEFKQDYLGQIAAKFEEFGGFLYKSKYGYYGAILPVNQSYLSNLNKEYKGNLLKNRSNDDILQKYETILASLDKFYQIGKEKVNIRTKMIVSIYGIHDVDVEKLINSNFLYLKQFIVFNSNLAQNYVQLINPKYFLKINEQVQNYNKIFNFINQAEFDIKLQETEINHKMYVRPQFFWLKKFTCNLSKILSYFDQNSACLLQRYLALKAIEKYSLTEKPHQLIVDFPISELNNITFSASKILKKIQIFNLTNKNIVLFFNGKNFVYDEVFTNNLKDLDNHKITYLFDKKSIHN